MNPPTLCSTALIFLAFCGCATTNDPQTVRQPAEQPSVTASQTVLVNLHRLGRVRVPVPATGASLRRIISDARDIGSRNGSIVLSHALNNIPVADRNKADPITGLTPDDLQLRLDNECIAVARRSTLFIAPTILVNNTAVGSFRILPGDVLQSIPFPIVNKMKHTAGGDISVSSDHFASRTFLGKKDKGPSLEQVSNFGDGNYTSKPSLRPDILRPNIAVISRVFSGRAQTIVVPCRIRADVGKHVHESDLLSSSNGLGDVYKTMSFAAGDHVHLTRPENIPAIRLALALPPAPRLTDRVVSDNAQVNQRHVGQAGAAKLAERFPRLSAIEGAKQQALSRVGRLVP